MARRCVLACLVLAALAGGASANGRPPGTSSISFRQGHETDIVAGLTFGLVISRDGGATWAWMCEDAIGYKSAYAYDPRFAFTPSGALFATTLTGLKVMRNGCTFDATPAGGAFISTDLLGPDRAIYYAASQTADPAHGIAEDFAIYKSTDDGVTFPTRLQPPGAVNWWQTLMVAPMDSMRLYLTGYRYVPNPSGPGTIKEHLLLRSDNGGAAWTPLPVTDFTLMPNSVIDIVGIARDPTHVYARVEFDDNTQSDSIYRSTDAGAHWQRINHKAMSIPAFLVRSNGDLIVGAQTLGAEISRDNGDHWTPLAGAPRINCLAENAAHEIWACTQNYAPPGMPSDDAGIMKTTDLVSWTKVLRYQDLTEAVTCAAGTVQKDTCAAQWCGVCKQLGCTPAASYQCPLDADLPGPPPPKGGCCQGSEGGGAALALGLAVGTLLLRPRRRTS
jgi:hypothetical protein